MAPRQAVFEVMKQLALKLVEDGEGVTKVAEIRVEGTRSIDGARKVAFSVANSQLVRTPFSERSKFRPLNKTSSPSELMGTLA
jgi:N-acetylglutamate synthase/N-acetylornithine aminotransferase